MSDLKIEYVDIDTVCPYENNAKVNDGERVPLIANSIKEFGFRYPVTVDENNVIISGHARVKAAKTLGIQRIPIVRIDDLTPNQVRALRIIDNKVTEFGKWDEDILEEEIEAIGEDINFAMFGFEEVGEPDKEKVGFGGEKELQLLVIFDNKEDRKELLQRLEDEGYECRIPGHNKED